MKVKGKGYDVSQAREGNELLGETRNAPSAATERIDRIEKCHFGLCNSLFS